MIFVEKVLFQMPLFKVQRNTLFFPQKFSHAEVSVKWLVPKYTNIAMIASVRLAEKTYQNETKSANKVNFLHHEGNSSSRHLRTTSKAQRGTCPGKVSCYSRERSCDFRGNLRRTIFLLRTFNIHDALRELCELHNLLRCCILHDYVRYM